MIDSIDRAENLDALKEYRSELISHAHFEKHFDRLNNVIQSKLMEPDSVREVLMFLGPARVGKSCIFEELDGRYGGIHDTETGRTAGLLYVTVPPKGSDGAILSAILRAVNEPYKTSKSIDAMTQRVQMRLKALSIKVIIFDEVNHCVDEGRKASVRSASDFFKGLIDDNPGITFIFAGLPLASKLREVNPQFSGRCDAPDYFLPYDWTDATENAQFAGAIYPLYELISQMTIDYNLSFEQFRRACYLLSGGRFGMVMKFLNSLINQFEQDKAANGLTVTHLINAFFKTVETTGFISNPFELGADIKDDELEAAWVTVMKDHGLMRFVGSKRMLGVTV